MTRQNIWARFVRAGLLGYHVFSLNGFDLLRVVVVVVVVVVKKSSWPPATPNYKQRADYCQ